MFLKDDLFISLRYIKSRLIESLMIFVSIAFCVAVISCVFSIIKTYYLSLEDNINRNQYYRRIIVTSKSNYNSNNVAVLKIKAASRADVQFGIEDMNSAKSECPAVNFSYSIEGNEFFIGDDPWGRRPGPDEEQAVANAEIPANSSLKKFQGYGVFPDFIRFYDLRVKAGSSFISGDIENGNPVLVLGANLRTQLFPVLEDEEILGKTIRLNSRAFKIIGILEKDMFEDDSNRWSKNNLGYFPYTSSRVFQYRKYLRSIEFGVTDTADIPAAVRQLENFFSLRFGEETFVISSNYESFEEQKNRIEPVLFIVMILSVAVLLIACINIFNLMQARILKRLKNIGISKALGATKSAVFYQLFLETILLSLSGALFGILISNLLMLVFQTATRNTNINIYLSSDQVVYALLLSLTLTTIFGIFPAFGAAGTKTVDIIRTE